MKKETKNIDSSYKKEIKEKTRKEFKKKDLANMSNGRALSIVNGPSVSMKEKEQILSNIKRKIEYQKYLYQII